jgi:hypothetical protein
MNPPISSTRIGTFERIPAGLLLYLVVFSIGLFVIACSDDQPVVEGDDAAGLLPGALLSPADMPGGNWTVTEDDPFAFNASLASIPACGALASLLTRVDDEATARARTRLWANPGPVVQIELAAFSTGDVADGLIADRRALSGEEIVECSGQTAKRGLRDLSARVIPSTPSAAAPHDGVAYADDRDIAGPQGARTNIHSETYVWRQGSVYVRVDLLALGGVDLTDLATRVLKQVSDAASAILGSE